MESIKRQRYITSTLLLMVQKILLKLIISINKIELVSNKINIHLNILNELIITKILLRSIINYMKKKQQEFKPSSAILKLQKETRERNQIFSSSLQGRSVSNQSNEDYKRRFQIKLNPDQKLSLQKPIPMKKAENRLQSIVSQQKFSIANLEKKKSLNKQKQTIHDMKQFTKKLNIKFGAFLEQKNDDHQKQTQMDIEKQDQVINQNLVKPSEIYALPKPVPNYNSIFQTPPLPCFQQQKVQYPHQQDTPQKLFSYDYDSCGNLVTENYKRLAKQGVWKIGKIKIRGQKSQLLIGGIKFQGYLGYGEGKIAAIKDKNFIQLGDWSGMWIVEPHKQIFQ